MNNDWIFKSQKVFSINKIFSAYSLTIFAYSSQKNKNKNKNYKK